METDNNKDEQIAFIVFSWIRNNCKNIYIPFVITKIIIEFTQKCFKKSNILNIKQDLDLVHLLSKELTNYIKKYVIDDLIYRASDYDFEYEEFHAKFNEYEQNEKLAGNVVIIESALGNIFGGFTSKCWNASSNCHVKDKYAFIFLLKSDRKEIDMPITFKLKKEHESYAIYCYKNCGPIFGNGYDIYIGKKTHYTPNSSTLQSYHNENYIHNPWTRSIAGGYAKQFELIDYEVFAITH